MGKKFVKNFSVRAFSYVQVVWTNYHIALTRDILELHGLLNLTIGISESIRARKGKLKFRRDPTKTKIFKNRFLLSL